MDAVSLDRLLEEVLSRLHSRHLGRVKLVGRSAVSLEIGKDRLWLELGTEIPGLFLLSLPGAREQEALSFGEPSGAARQFLLHARKHVAGGRVVSLSRVAGRRVVLLETGGATLALRLSGTPALSLVVDGVLLASLGGGAPAWPGEPDPEGEWSALTEARIEAARRSADGAGSSRVRALAAACPTLTRRLLQEVAEDPSVWPEVRTRLEAPRPILLLPEGGAAAEEAELGPGSVAVAPLVPAGYRGSVVETGSFSEAANAALLFALRGRAFLSRQREDVQTARKERRRLFQLVAHLRRDQEGLRDPAELRHHGEALLAHGGEAPHGGSEITVADPRAADRGLRVAIDPRLSLPKNADKLFAQARRIDHARREVAGRHAMAQQQLDLATLREEAVSRARVPGDLDRVPAPPERASRVVETEESSRRHYLTSRGISVLIGRGARENHEITFGIAGPEDLWLHARDVPGAHVILRDRDRRAGDADIREAAEIAAFFSDAKAQGAVDVHVARRKHIRPGRGSAGKVTIGHSDTVRAIPRDPEGRLRRRRS